MFNVVDHSDTTRLFMYCSPYWNCPWWNSLPSLDIYSRVSQSYSFTAHWGQIMNNDNINWSKLLINAWPGRLPSSWPFGSFGLSIMRIWSKNWYHHSLFPLPSCYKILYSIAIILMKRGNNAACYLIILKTVQQTIFISSTLCSETELGNMERDTCALENGIIPNFCEGG